MEYGTVKSMCINFEDYSCMLRECTRLNTNLIAFGGIQREMGYGTVKLLCINFKD